MKVRAAGRRPPAHLAAAAVALPLLAAQPAHAAAAARVEFAYTSPRVTASGERTIWGWTIRNTGDRTAYRVVLTHELAPKLRIASLTSPCVIVQGGAIRCEYATLRPGERRTGALTAIVPRHLHGKVQIKGHATWWQRPHTH